MMGPTKAVVRENRLYEVLGGKLIKDGFANRQELEDYVNHHYVTLPVLDNAGNPWLLDGKPVYCLRGTQYETVDDQRVHLARCPDCGDRKSEEHTSELQSRLHLVCRLLL